MEVQCQSKMNSNSWCHIEYIIDRERANVPLTFFQNYDTLITLKKGKSYKVFWAENPNETPESLLKREGKILNIDDIKRRYQTKKKNTIMSGYYNATFLEIADGEEELLNALESDRVKIPSHRLSLDDDLMNNNMAPPPLKIAKKSLAEEARIKNLERLGLNTDDMAASKSSSVEIPLDPTTTWQEKCICLQSDLDVQRETAKMWEAKYLEVVGENRTLTKLNLEWQQKILSAGTSSEPVVIYKHENRVAISDETIVFDFDESNNDIQKIDDAEVNVVIDDAEVNVVENESMPTFHVSDLQIEEASKGIRAGKDGDSRFVKNLAEILWTRGELQKRSATGNGRPDNKEDKLRPECTPAKKKYIADLLEKRMDAEKNQPSEEERATRIKNITGHLGSKIKTVRRSLDKL